MTYEDLIRHVGLFGAEGETMDWEDHSTVDVGKEVRGHLLDAAMHGESRGLSKPQRLAMAVLAHLIEEGN